MTASPVAIKPFSSETRTGVYHQKLGDLSKQSTYPKYISELPTRKKCTHIAIPIVVGGGAGACIGGAAGASCGPPGVGTGAAIGACVGAALGAGVSTVYLYSNYSKWRELRIGAGFDEDLVFMLFQSDPELKKYICPILSKQENILIKIIATPVTTTCGVLCDREAIEEIIEQQEKCPFIDCALGEHTLTKEGLRASPEAAMRISARVAHILNDEVKLKKLESAAVEGLKALQSDMMQQVRWFHADAQREIVELINSKRMTKEEGNEKSQELDKLLEKTVTLSTTISRAPTPPSTGIEDGSKESGVRVEIKSKKREIKGKNYRKLKNSDVSTRTTLTEIAPTASSSAKTDAVDLMAVQRAQATAVAALLSGALGVRCTLSGEHASIRYST